MTATHEELEEIFAQYQEAWNSCDASRMNALLSEQLQVRWVWHNSNEIAEWGYENACKGWVEAFGKYKGENPKWHFKILHMTPTGENEGMAVFWATFELNGKSTGMVNLFVHTFQKEKGEWKLVREYCESSMPESFVRT